MTHHYTKPVALLALAILPIAPTFADIYKCTLADGTVAFQQECPAASKAEKQNIKQISNLGFDEESSATLAINDELLSNGDFETDTSGWKISGAASTLEREGTAGTTALQLNADGKEPSKIRLSQCLPTSNVGSVEASAFIKQEGSATLKDNELRIVWFTSDDCTSGGQYGARLHPTAAPGWQRLMRKIEPALGANSVMVELEHNNNGKNIEPSQALWDEVSLKVVTLETSIGGAGSHSRPLGENHILNANFDNQLKHWTSVWPLEWQEYGGESVSAGAYTRAQSDFGQKKVADALEQCVDIGQNKVFDAGISFKQDGLSSQSGQAILRLTWFQKAGCQGRQQFGADVAALKTAGWQSLKTSLTAPPGAQSLIFRLEQHVDNSGFYGAFWDNAYIIATQ